MRREQQIAAEQEQDWPWDAWTKRTLDRLWSQYGVTLPWRDAGPETSSEKAGTMSSNGQPYNYIASQTPRFGELLDELRERGFIPNEGDADWFDFNFRDSTLAVPRAKVRVALDDNTVIVYVMTGNGVLLWVVRLSDGTPLSIIASVIDQAIGRAVAAEDAS